MDQETINRINLEAPNLWGESEQGIFVEPFGMKFIELSKIKSILNV